MSRLKWMACSIAPIALSVIGCSQSGPAAVDQERLENAESDPNNWMTHGRTFREDRYSPLSDINLENISSLGLAWSHELTVPRATEATPIVVDGVMYVTSSWSIVHALDAATGEELWMYDPQVPRERLASTCCGPVNRGVAVWEGKVYVGTLDGRLIALSAKTGTEIWSKVTVDQSQPYTITGAPRAAKGLIFIGNGGAEFGVRGYVSAYDATSGNLRWRFYTTPNPEGPDNAVSDSQRDRMLATWNPKEGAWLETGGGGTVWDAIVYDQDSDTLWIGTGNGTPWTIDSRSPKIEGRNNDNLFLNSIVAVDAQTGEYKCHFQQIPELNWDYTASQPMILSEMEIDGIQRKVLMQAPKNGYFYVIDRTNCEFISAGSFARQTWTKGIDKKTGKPIINQEAMLRNGPAFILPSGFGAHSWHPMAMSQDTGLIYIPIQEIPEEMTVDSNFTFRPGRMNLGIIEPILADTPEEMAGLDAALSGHLIAWDPVAQKEIWRVKLPGAVNGGTLATAGGLVFQGLVDGSFVAYDARSGKKLWQTDNGAPSFGGPISYKVGNTQYIATVASYGTPIFLAGGLALPKIGDKENGRVNVYKIGGVAKLPERNRDVMPAPRPPEMNVSNQTIRRGAHVYAQNCIFCHGIAVVGGGVVQDLRTSPVLQSAEAWRATVHGGRLQDGMPDFTGFIDNEDAEAIRSYVVGKAWLLYREEQQRQMKK